MNFEVEQDFQFGSSCWAADWYIFCVCISNLIWVQMDMFYLGSKISLRSCNYCSYTSVYFFQFMIRLYFMIRLVRSYLLHYGYEETLISFDLAGKSTIPPICIAQENAFDEQDIMYALNQRRTLRQVWIYLTVDFLKNLIRSLYRLYLACDLCRIWMNSL